MLSAEEERDAALAVIEKAHADLGKLPILEGSFREVRMPTQPLIDVRNALATVDRSALAARDAEKDRRITDLRDHLRHAAVAFSEEGTALRDRAERAESELGTALAAIEKAPHGSDCQRLQVMPTAAQIVDGTWEDGECSCWKSRVDTSALGVRDAELIAERDAALAVIAEVREALAPGRPLYASLGAARAALEKVSD